MFDRISAFLDSLTGRNGSIPLDEDEKTIAAAALLAHAIAIDGIVTEEEQKTLAALLASHFQLETGEVNRLLTMAEKREREAVDLYRFTTVLRDGLTVEERRDIVAMMWRLVYADGTLAPLEDNLVWRTAELLAVPARDRMLLKQMVRDSG